MTSNKELAVAIDGPSGSGKSTLGKKIAKELGFLYIDSGAVYRAVGVKAIQSRIPLEDRNGVTQVAREAEIRLEGDPESLSVFLDGYDVSLRIRQPDASSAASVVGTIPEVRAIVVDKLREMSRNRGIVMDGRDIGTKVFPNAVVKLFIEASTEERAKRRMLEDIERGREVSLDQMKSEIEERDRRDRTRAATPLVPADDAIILDTTRMSIDQVLDKALEIINSRI